ncbi:Glycosyltransferase involved in cell wall bisynthesis [Salinibacillus kushneri]|uniref:Glycosyltransferase involved in cell wall bisynthesis n=1 Tax=Salinibacillus kushneri TaxID=237682 RepID=A0A1I0D0G9_9BACI|nr:glycosyltransferase [Salinibacillus kushneri]SET25642.1 Glycosyltransferase involved in cell wall bisynthesis [Salinibacillus kushneri]
MKRKSKRILVLSNMYPGKVSSTFGIFVENQVEGIRKRGIYVDVLAVQDPRMGKYFVIKKYLKWSIRILYSFLTKGRSYDLIHAHYVFPSGMFALLFKKWFGTKMIVTAHGGDIDKMSKKSRFFFNKTKQILNNADFVIAVGENLRKDITDTFRVDADKTAVINMGVNREVFQPIDKMRAKELLGRSSSKFYLLYVGNLIKQKGLLELIDAFRHLRQKYSDLELHLIGPVKNEVFLSQLKQKIADENIEDLYIHPAKGQKEIAKWMAASDVFVLPSHIEGFGLVALEAMSCHTPVVGSDVGGLSYLLKDSGILISPKDSSSLYKGLEKLIVNEGLRMTLIKQGEKKAQENDQELLLDRLMEIYGHKGGKIT